MFGESYDHVWGRFVSGPQTVSPVPIRGRFVSAEQDATNAARQDTTNGAAATHRRRRRRSASFEYVSGRDVMRASRQRREPTQADLYACLSPEMQAYYDADDA